MTRKETAQILKILKIAYPNFIRSYKARQEHEKEYLALPKSVREFTQEVANALPNKI